MQVHCIQHLPIDDSITLGEWAASRGHRLVKTHHPTVGMLPEPDSVDMLVITGGFMSGYDEKNHPWLVREKAFIREIAMRGLPILGLCLGAQLLADTLGGRARPHDIGELGWFEVRSLPEIEAERRFGLPDRFMTVQWHNDNFDLPPEAVRLAETPACANQAFSWRDNVLACQFHLEYSSENMHELLAACDGKLGSGPYIQSPEEIRPTGPDDQRVIAIRELFFHLLDRLATVRPQ